MQDVGVRAGSRAVERPQELAKGHRQAAQRNVTLGPGIVQSLSLCCQVSRHCGQQFRFVEIEGLAQFEFESPVSRFGAGKPELEDRRRPAVEVAAFGDRLKYQSGVLGGRFKRGRKS